MMVNMMESKYFSKNYIIKKGLFLILILLSFIITSCEEESVNHFEKSWSSIDERVWVGSEFWSNRLQDWKIQNNRLECIATDSKLLMRTTHLINHRLSKKKEDFLAEIDAGVIQSNYNMDAACGFLLGAGVELDVWGASLIQQKIGPGAGLFVGVTVAGELFVKDMENGKKIKTLKTAFLENNRLKINLNYDDEGYILNLIYGDDKLTISKLSPERFVGNIAMVSHPGIGENPASFWFNNLEVSGNKLEKFEERVGPILSSQYTLSNNVLNMTAQLTPIAKTDPLEVILEVKKEHKWQEVSNTKLITPGYTATFNVSNWNSTVDTSYRIKYVYRSSTNDNEIDYWKGVIRHDPVEKNQIVIAGFTGNHNISKPGLSGTKGTFNFNPNGIWYPHKEIVESVKVHNPDVLFFSGDQIYEGASPTFADRNNYELDYLYKWYLYCIAYRDLTKDIPTISIPDDHDIYQGNLWGQEGRLTDRDNKGGYVHPAWFVKMVERTQCSNLPKPYDPTPINQDIGVYYTSMTYGGIGFAILEDRKFKSGCGDNPFITTGRVDHVIDPEFDVKKIDLVGKKLLGDRQLSFINDWGRNWKGQDMKIALSQTIFANMATHHGQELFRLIADLDSNGWPQTGRNKAIDALRKSFSFHMAGDQHLASMIQHGIDDWNDAIYSFCVPSIANFYPRAWWPESIGIDRPEGSPQNLGKHKDGFGNFVTVYGVTNPSQFTNVSTNREPLELHDKMPGYGIVKMNKVDRTIRMECWPRYANPKNDKEQFAGWPKTISQFDNYGKKAVAYLPTILIKGTTNPVIEIKDEKSGEVVYSVRIKGNEFKPKVFKNSSYVITLKDTERDIEKVFTKVLPITNDKKFISVEF